MQSYIAPSMFSGFTAVFFLCYKAIMFQLECAKHAMYMKVRLD